MTIIPIIAVKIESENTTASPPLSEADKQMQLEIDEALWLDRRDYYQFSQVA
ncbi:hypothetical protein [Chamaesiphon polymorphus]|nr:hypothetical protein [Chamaesiphon polymorphus]